MGSEIKIGDRVREDCPGSVLHGLQGIVIDSEIIPDALAVRWDTPEGPLVTALTHGATKETKRDTPDCPGWKAKGGDGDE